jgi:hypothetical protein
VVPSVSRRGTCDRGIWTIVQIAIALTDPGRPILTERNGLVTIGKPEFVMAIQRR